MNLLRRPLLVFGALLIGPAAVLAWLGWRSVEHEDRLRRDRLVAEAAKAAEDAATEDAALVERIRAREEKRPFYQYQEQFSPADAITSNGPAFVQSALATGNDLPAFPERPAWWFQWSMSNGAVAGPETFEPGEKAPSSRVAAQLPKAFVSALVARLEAAPKEPGLFVGPAVPTPLRVLAANEEQGQLLEEVEVAQRSSNGSTGYLDGFRARVQGRVPQTEAEPSVGVRYTPFRYVVFPPEVGDVVTPSIVAWRLVWIPGGEAKSQRDAPVDRWLLQGYALRASLRLELPASDRVLSSLRPGSPRDRELRFDDMGLAFDAFPRSSLLTKLTVEVPPHRTGLWDSMFEYVGVPDSAAWHEGRSQGHWQYILSAGGLLGVTCLGFFVLIRSVRRETSAARRKEDFVAAVTHELKTPLASIRMYADMLKEGWVPDGETSGDYAQRIVDETKRLGSLVDQVLDLAAFDRGVASFHPVPGDLGEAVRSAVALVEPVGAEAGVAVRVDVEEGLPLVSFDPALLRPIVLNLLDNAIKYSARSETKDVRVAVARAGAGVALSVSDRGVGIAAKDKAHLFQPFSRGGREETRTARGVGLGLALVKRYVDAHGAKVVLESEEGKGTTVVVTFAG